MAFSEASTRRHMSRDVGVSAEIDPSRFTTQHVAVMPSSRLHPEVARVERAIESKQRLLDFLRSRPRYLTMETFLCLTRIPAEGSWTLEGERWRKQDQCLSTLEVDQLEVTRQ
jgi:hypothetical protein